MRRGCATRIPFFFMEPISIPGVNHEGYDYLFRLYNRVLDGCERDTDYEHN